MNASLGVVIVNAITWVKLYSSVELNEEEKLRFFVDGDYADQLRKRSVCGSGGSNLAPHTDLDILQTRGEWKEICLDCFRKA
jgi:hypothetical protein